MFGANRREVRPGDKPRPPIPTYGTRRAQVRLLLAVFCWMGVLLLIFEAAKPARWQWLWGTAAPTPRQPAVAHLPEEAVDTRQPPPRPAAAPADAVAITTDITMSDPASDNGSASGVPGIAPERFAVLRDNSVLRSTETELWFEVLAALRGLERTPERLPPAPHVGFTQLYKQPDVYRGRRVRISGMVRRCHRLTAPQNQHDISHYYRCWLFPEGSTNPIVVYTLTMPDGFPTGMSIEELVVFDGVFFKRWAYAAKGGLMAAPLVLSAAGQWTPRAVGPMRRLPSLPAVVLGILVAAIVAAWVSWHVYRRSLRLGQTDVR